MSYRLEGACHQCGKCCQVEAAFWLKPYSDDHAERDASYCRYIYKKGNKMLCKLREWYDEHGDVKPPRIPIWVWKYFKEQCLPFPNPDEPDHQPPKYDFPDYCGYRWIRSDG